MTTKQVDTKRIKRYKTLKRRVLKKFPDAILHMDDDGKFYIADGKGFHIIPEEYVVPNARDVITAWENTEFMVKVDTMLDKNRRRFSDEKVARRFFNKE